MTSPRNIWLSLELGGERGSLSLHRVEGGNLSLLHRSFIGGRFDHAEKLIPAIDTALEASRTTLTSLGRLLTCDGPGSFTGMRIAYSALKALAISQNIPLASMNGSEARNLAFHQEKSHHDRPDSTWILSYYSQTQVVLARFTKGNEAFEERVYRREEIPAPAVPTQILLDEKTKPESIPQHTLFTFVEFPLRAEQLAEGVAMASSLKLFSNPKEIILASPNYFGDFRATSAGA